MPKKYRTKTVFTQKLYNKIMKKARQVIEE